MDNASPLSALLYDVRRVTSSRFRWSNGSSSCPTCRYVPMSFGLRVRGIADAHQHRGLKLAQSVDRPTSPARARGTHRLSTSVKHGRRSYLCDRDLHRPLHLLEGAGFDLPHPLARDAKLGREIVQRARLLGKTARLEDAPFAFVEHRQRFAQRLPAVLGLLAVGKLRFLVGPLLDQPILPFA